MLVSIFDSTLNHISKDNINNYEMTNKDSI